jgi:hypothetical protein
MIKCQARATARAPLNSTVRRASMSLVAHTRARIFGTTDSWSLTAHPGSGPEGRDCSVRLEISGDARNGYHLAMSPEGFFTADSWYISQEEALASASELFKVAACAWKETAAQGSPDTSLERAREG